MKTLSDVDLGDEELAAEVRREVDRIVSALPEDASCLLTGSLIEGLGNRNSDIDLYVVHGSGALANPVGLGMRRSRYVDCEYMTLSSLDALADQVGGGWAALLDLPRAPVDRFYRVSVAVQARLAPGAGSVLGRFDKGAACRVGRDWSLLNAYRMLARGALHLASGSAHAAALHLRQAALWRSNSALSEAGEGYPAAKWVAEKAARRYGHGSARYRELTDPFLRPAGSPADRLAEVRAGIRLPAELDALLSGRSCALAPRVRHVREAGGDFLVRGRAAVAEVGGVVAAVCGDMAAGAAWAAATARHAALLGMPETEFRTALWHRTEGLRSSGFLRLTD